MSLFTFMFFSSKKKGLLYLICSGFNMTFAVEPGFYRWSPVSLKLRRRTRLRAKPNSLAKEQRNLIPLCFLFKYIEGLILQGLNVSFIICTLACCWVKACIRLRTNFQALDRRDGFQKKIQIGFKVLIFLICSSRRINSLLLSLDKQLLIFRLHITDCHSGTQTWKHHSLSLGESRLHLWLNSLLCFVVLKSWVDRALGIKGCFKLLGTLLLNGKAFGYFQKITPRIFLTFFESFFQS